MNENQSLGAIGRRRPAFAATPNYKQEDRVVQATAPANDAAGQSRLEDDAASMKPTAGVVQVETGASHSPTQTEVHNYTVSVDEIRERLQTLCITKSKDTIQRYCREGLLDAERLGLMRRYYATETSVEALLEKLQQDAGASNGAQVHAGTAAEDTKQNYDPNAGADTRTQAHAGEHTGSTNVAGVEHELRNQIGDLKGEIEFLRDELVDRREQAKALQDVIAGMRDQSKANLLNAETQAQSRSDADQGTSYTASVLRNEPAETQEAEEGDNQQSAFKTNGV